MYIYNYAFSINILTFYLTFFLAYSDILSGILPGICSDIISGICADILSGILSGIYSDILARIYSGILSGILCGILSGMGTARPGARSWSPALPTALRSLLRFDTSHGNLELTVEVIWNSRLKPGSALTSGARGWGPAVPTAIWSSRLRSGSAHWHLELTVEARQCPLTSGARSWRLRSGSAHWHLELVVDGWGLAVPTEIWSSLLGEAGRKEGGREVILIKSRDPHLTGGEQV